MKIAHIGQKVLAAEAKAIENAISRIGEEFEQAVNILYDTKGRVVVTGMGKSGLIGKKISATLTSTGTPSVFLHPSEALHGDIGIIADNDVVMALSTSGETYEVLRLLVYIKRIGVKLVSLVGDPLSSLAKASDVFIDCGVENEACPIGLVPSTSTTLTLAVGDAISIALMDKKGFSEENFRYYHPGGSIGKKLLMVKHLMHVGEELPLVTPYMFMTNVLPIMSEKKFGIAIVVDDEFNVAGIITDGDLRRLLLKNINFASTQAADCMTRNPMSIREDNLAVEALKIMESRLITSLVVLENNRLKGLLHLHDLWRTEMI
ncbi:MAG: KpsF/GutQ family sugar-phosphate isomerase [Acidobacteria bacterium]|jgi:arabinose-5-phosphate isomerase|nr:KpsF/GutQ family sugar-phosphate isomerase [Acidobacteriota bacterium]